MRLKKRIAVVMAAVAACGTITFAYQKPDAPREKSQGKQDQPAAVEFITAEELKAKIAKKESLAILDLRAESAYSQSDKTIKGSLHTKVRKVVTRLRDAPRDKEVITYCACPSDEAAASPQGRLWRRLQTCSSVEGWLERLAPGWWSGGTADRCRALQMKSSMSLNGRFASPKSGR